MEPWGSPIIRAASMAYDKSGTMEPFFFLLIKKYIERSREPAKNFGGV
jgi:hypothetical protein